MRSGEGIRYEPDERCPPFVSATVGLQGMVLILTTSLLYVAVIAVGAGQGDAYLAWAAFAALAINGAGTALQAARVGRLGTGHVLTTGTATPFIAISITALSEGGPAMLASLVVASSLLQFALAAWAPLLRRIITPLVSGTVLMLVSATVVPVAMQRLKDVPDGLSAGAGPSVAAATLAVTIAMGLWPRTSGTLRLWTPLAGIFAGCIAAGFFGLYDAGRFFDAPWVGIPAFAVPGFAPPLTVEFWSLLPLFIVMTLVSTIQVIGGGIAVQQVSWRTPRVTDFRLVQGAVYANGVTSLLSGVAGIMPTFTHTANSVSITSFTGVASRHVGYAIAVILIGLALLPKLTALLVMVPGPVAGGFLLIIMGQLMVQGIRMVAQDGLDFQKALVVGVSFSLGTGLQGENLFGDVPGGAWGMMWGNAVLTGGLSAILMTGFMELVRPARRRLRVDLAVSALPEINGFLRRLVADRGWNDASADRLCLVGEEVLLSLLGELEPGRAVDGRSLTILARPDARTVDLEFLATPQDKNIEDRMAYLGEQTELSGDHEISFRLLRHYASTVRHRKYHGIDIVTVQVERSF